MKLGDLIEEKYRDMSAGHKRVAAYIQSNETEFAYLTSKEVAKRAGVSEATVVRFAYFLGFSRYKDLQELVRTSLTGAGFNISEKFRDEGEAANWDKPHMKAVEQDMKNIHESFVSLDEERVEAVVDVLLKARHVGALGYRGSIAPAMLLHHFMSEMFENSCLLSPGFGTTLDTIKNWDDRDVLVCFEFIPTKGFTYSILEYARQRGCKVISITSTLAYTIKDLSDFVLEVKKDGTFISYTAAVVMVNMLLDRMADKARGRIMENYEETMKILKQVHYG